MLADAAYLRSLGNLSDDVGEGLLNPHLEAAADELLSWVGEEAYADAGQAIPADTLRARRLRRAEAHLALAKAFTSLAGNFKAGQGFVGGASQAQGEASFLTPVQVQELIKQHLALAEREAAAYLPGAVSYVGAVNLDG